MYLTQIDRSETDKTKLKKDGGKLNTRKNPMLDLGDKMFRFPKKRIVLHSTNSGQRLK